LYVKNFNVFLNFILFFYCVLVRVTVYVGCLSGVINDDDDDDYKRYEKLRHTDLRYDLFTNESRALCND